MSFATNYERFTETYDGIGTHPLFLAQAALIYSGASDGELEVLARQFIPADFALIEAAGGAG